MTKQECKDIEALQALRVALAVNGKAKTNNELFNAMLNGCKHSMKVFQALTAFPKEAMTNG